MSEAESDQYVKLVQGPTQPAGSGFGYLLIGGMALTLVVLGAYGFQQATDLPPLIGILLASLVCIVRLYMLRRRPSHERVSGSGLERAGVCAPASFLAVAMAAFAIFNFSVSGTQVPRRPRMTDEQLETAIIAIEDYYHVVRTKLATRNNLNELRRSQLKSEPPSPERKEEIERLDREQPELKKLLRLVVAGVRPNDPAPLPDSLEDEESAIKRISPGDETAVRRRFDEAARLHQQLPDFIRDEVELPKLESLPTEPIHGSKLEQFIRETLAVTRQAIGCWAVPGVLELFIIILVLTNRRRD